jgi:hypothetical protein
MPRLSGVRRFSVRLDDVATLQDRGQAMDETWADHWMALKFLRQIFQEGAALQWMDWRRGGLDRGKFIVGKTERHIGNSSGGLRPRWR